MEGEKVELKEDEKDFFAQLARDYTWYKEIVENLQTVKIDNIQNLFKLIRFDFKDDGERKSALVNSWFNIHKNKYIEEIFKSKLGDHLVHRSIYNLLSIERKIKLLKAALLKSLKENLRDYKAGCFMLGLFISTSHPVYFWESFSPQEISMLLNEWICYEKYIKILFQVGEKKINKAREYILTQGLPDIYLHSGNISVFIPLKLSKIDLKKVKQAIPEGSDPQTDELLNILLKPYSDFYDFEAKWSVHRLEVICEENNVSVPAPNDK
jgi:hypothetical protein